MDIAEIVRRTAETHGVSNLTLAEEFALLPGDLQVSGEVRRMCEQNLCGKYGRNWACPPNAPPCETCRMLLGGYSHTVLIRTTYARSGPFDMDEMEGSGRRHNEFTRQVRDALAGNGIVGCKVLAAGGCSYCGECSCPGSPCRFPSERMFSIEAYGIDITSFLLKHGIPARSGSGEQSFFSMVLYRGADPAPRGPERIRMRPVFEKP